jgi:hypothetical protein
MRRATTKRTAGRATSRADLLRRVVPLDLRAGGPRTLIHMDGYRCPVPCGACSRSLEPTAARLGTGPGRPAPDYRRTGEAGPRHAPGPAGGRGRSRPETRPEQGERCGPTRDEACRRRWRLRRAETGRAGTIRVTIAPLWESGYSQPCPMLPLGFRTASRLRSLMGNVGSVAGVRGSALPS